MSSPSARVGGNTPPPQTPTEQLAEAWTGYRVAQEQTVVAREALKAARAEEARLQGVVVDLLLDLKVPGLDLAYATFRHLGVPMRQAAVLRLRRNFYEAKRRAARRRHKRRGPRRPR